MEVQADGSLAYPGVLITTDGSGIFFVDDYLTNATLAHYLNVGMCHVSIGSEKPTSLPSPLTVDEEILIQRFYEQKIQQVCAAFSFPHKIQVS